MNIAPATEKMWRTLCVEVGLPDLPNDARFTTNERRVAHRDLVHRTIEERIRLKPRAEWMERLLAGGIPAGPINRLDEVFADAQVRHCRMVRDAQHPFLGAIPQLALPLHFESMDVQEPGLAPPTLGEHSVAILHSHGFADGEIESLIARRIVIRGAVPRAS
jgi:formyl-CoA transferase